MTDSQEKTILITGSTDGLGRRCVERLARPGITLLIHGRNASQGKSLLTMIRNAGGEGALFCADFSCLDDVRRMADAIGAEHQRLDVLVNNAGIGTRGTHPGRSTSRDGYELRFGVNYLAGFLLTYALMPQLKAAPAARIVNVASAGQQEIDFSNIMLTQGYSGQRAYCQSKLAQILHALDLAEGLKSIGITANALHPATYMDTKMVRGDGMSAINSVDTGADALLSLAMSPALEGQTGLYFDGMRPARAAAQAYNPNARRRLRDLSLEFCGLPAAAA
jgi:NAD(P)-dependent dehydrogenase (short-subunit alcohol dehydrogenase family)